MAAQYAPPPELLALLDMMRLLLMVPWKMPPPYELATLVKMKQLLTTADGEAHQTPPPDNRLVVSPEVRVAPLVKVKPLRSAPLVSQAQRTAAVPLVMPVPWIKVTVGPLTLWTVSAEVSATRFVRSPYMTRPPAV